MYDPASTQSLFEFENNSRLRGHMYKIHKQFTNKTKYKNFFTNRIVTKWNSLPQTVVNANSINDFKNKVDFHFKDLMYKTDL